MIRRINIITITKLLQKDEGIDLDFKQQYPASFVTLLKDILCLANSLTRGNPKYLIFGIEDQTKKVIGIENDQRRKSQAMIVNYLEGRNLNKVPNISLKTFKIHGHEVDVLIIEDEACKPFYLLKDLKKKGECISAGRVYTRNKDVNIDSTTTASDDTLTAMFRERFGHSLSVDEKLRLYIQDSREWGLTIENHLFSFYYKIDPEFRLIQSKESEKIDFDRWVKHFPNDRLEYITYYFKYSSTTIRQVDIVTLNDGDNIFPKPSVLRTKNGFFSYFYYRGTVEFYLREMFSSFPSLYWGYENKLRKLFPVFDSFIQATDALEADSVKELNEYEFYFAK